MTIKTEKKLKGKAQKIARDLGFPLGTLVNAFLRQFVRNKTVYFTVLGTDVINQEMERHLDEIEKDIMNEKNISSPFDNMEHMLANLKNT